MTMSNPNRRFVTALATLLALSTAATACSDQSGSSGDGEKTDVSGLSESAQERVAAVYEGTGTSPATEGPKPQPGKSVWFVATGMAVESVSGAARGFQDAAAELGWKAKVFDGKFQPNQWLNGIEQAVAARADGIVLYAIDCPSVANGLAAAKAADIPVVAVESQDCDPSLESVVPYAEGNFAEWGQQLGEDMALWSIAKAGGKGKFIELRETDLAIAASITEGLTATFEKECPDCEVLPVEFTGADIGPGLQQKVEQALLKNPDAVGLLAPYDDLLVAGVSSAVVSSGRARQIQVISTGGSSSALEIMRDGRGLNAVLALSTRWEGFAAADWMNRLLNGETPTAESAPTGIGHQLIEVSKGLPETGGVASTVAFEDIYAKSWGAE